MKLKSFVLVATIAALTGCGAAETWVDTTAGDCDESQIEELNGSQQPMVVEMGTRTCTGAGLKAFAGEFRCTGSTEDGTRKMQAKCES